MEPEGDLKPTLDKNLIKDPLNRIDRRQKHASHVIYEPENDRVSSISGFFSDLKDNEPSGGSRKVSSDDSR